MKRLSSLPALASLVGAIAIGPQAMGAEPLKVSSRVQPGPYFVGQAIDVQVEVTGETGSPTIELPKPENATIRALPSDPSRFLVIPERPGSLSIPPFRARSGTRSGLSKPIRISVANAPADGRTSAFLGGVGAFELKAEVEPSSLMSGRTLEYRIKLSGPAAWGSGRAPDLAGWASLPSGFRVETLPDLLEGFDPPTRTFRYRLRPSKAGRVVLPPVAIAALDPKSRRYVTRTTSGQPIVVVEPPRFEPSGLNYEPIGKTPGGRPRGLFSVGLGLGVSVLAVLGFWLVKKRGRGSKPVDPQALAIELALGLVKGGHEAEAGRAVAEALTTFLQRVDGRAPGVLTPPEVYEGIERVTNDRDLATIAEKLVMRSDRARFGAGAGDDSSLIRECAGLFGRIAAEMGPASRPGGGPREAVETASH